MKYLLLIYESEQAAAQMSEAEQGEVFGGYIKFTQEIKASGHHKAGDALQPVVTAKSLRVRKGERLITDGPFAETREQLGGYYLIEAKDENEALDIAARIPSVRYGTIEVRPVMEFDESATA